MHTFHRPELCMSLRYSDSRFSIVLCLCFGPDSPQSEFSSSLPRQHNPPPLSSAYYPCPDHAAGRSCFHQPLTGWPNPGSLYSSLSTPGCGKLSFLPSSLLQPRRPPQQRREPPPGRPHATPGARNAGPQGRKLWGQCRVPTPTPTAPGTHGSRNAGFPPQRMGSRGRDSA